MQSDNQNQQPVSDPQAVPAQFPGRRRRRRDRFDSPEDIARLLLPFVVPPYYYYPYYPPYYPYPYYNPYYPYPYYGYRSVQGDGEGVGDYLD